LIFGYQLEQARVNLPEIAPVICGLFAGRLSAMKVEIIQ
jgi:hypothetical protein